MPGVDAAAALLPPGWRYSAGHTPHWYQRDSLPKHLRKRPFEAYVTNGLPIGSKDYIFESADGATDGEALATAIQLALSKRE